MRIALFDYKVVPTNPVGSCHLALVRGLCQEHEFTVFSLEFANPCPHKAKHVRIFLPGRPLAALFWGYYVLAPLAYLAHRLIWGRRFDLVQMVESNLSFGQVAYVHFCHRAYLRSHWKGSGARGLRGFMRYLDHLFHAWMEPFVFRRVRWLVVPSQGLKRELEKTYPFTRGKIHVIPNPVDLDRMRRPVDFDREGFRQRLGAHSEDVVMVFVALGHFERKGLPLLLEAMRELEHPSLKLWVVGGEADLVAAWRRRAAEMGLGMQVQFTGMQKDIRPFLWGADLFVLPSAYETFSLVSFEAAAAGLPLLVTHLYGVEEFMRDGETGFVVEGSTQGVRLGLERLLALAPHQREEMGRNAAKAVEGFRVENFVQRWREFYERLA